ncbi:hypothetical protein QVD17_38882 [Tagetes erecta]|uniref:Uncharacterized protein n=1 Tax=Tagetes erecta TaxID=13708 RepID=A0AAD8NGL3_TARER|nr:hypothetical protein QVD17_38882 [Tagetes erecta]
MSFLTNQLINEAWILSKIAHNNKHYVTNSKRHGVASSSSSVSTFAFTGSMEVDDLYLDDQFGETDVSYDLFPALRRVGESQPAKVNGSFLKIFQDLLTNSGFKLEVEKAIKEGKKILLTGHSFGAAIASLATLWMLDEYTRIRKTKLSIACVTFGSPLIGDGTLTHSVRREKWAGHFTHFVMEHDIVPRMMLAPKTSVGGQLSDILKFFHQKVNTITNQKSHKFPKIFNKKTPDRPVEHDQLVEDKQAVEFFENVMINASAVVSHDAFDLMEPTNSLKERLTADYVKVSPYRPFGTYVFCTSSEDLGVGAPRQQLVVENPNAVLQLLFYFLQMSNENQDLAKFAIESLAENFSYEEELNNNGLKLEKQDNLKDVSKDLLTKGATGDAVPTRNKALFELPASAKWCLLAAEEDEKRKEKNMEQFKKSMRNDVSNVKEPANKSIENMIKEIQDYKEKHGDGENDYYEAFKCQNEYGDFKANVNRLEQAKTWDMIPEMLMRKDLPDEFEVLKEFVDLAAQFRRLYEPMDIGNYYRHDKGDDTGAKYMAVRPKRYKFTQRIYEHAIVTGFEPESESNFVAEVEELIKEVIKLKNKKNKTNRTIEDVKKDFESIKDKIKKWKSDEKIQRASKDVYWGESILSKLQKQIEEA